MDFNPKPGTLEIGGTEGALVVDLETGYELIRPGEGGREVERGECDPSQWPAFYRNVVDHLVRNEPLVITPQWALRPIEILDLANRSARQGRAVRVRTTR